MLDVTELKARHRIRRRLKRKHKIRDRYKSKLWIRNWNCYIRRLEPDWTFNRRKSHCETGYGVAYEINSDADKY